MIEPNGVRFDPSRARGHVESYFLRLNDPERPRALWLKATILRRSGAALGDAVAEAWVVAFDRERGHVAHKRTVPWAAARFGRGPALDVEIAGCAMSDARAKGELGGLAWDLALERRGAPMLMYAPWAYRGRFPKQKQLSPMPDLVATGAVRAGGETWDVRGWPGALGHNWGERHTDFYTWAQVGAWEGLGRSPEGASELLFEGGTGKIRVGPLWTPMFTVLSVRWRGVRYHWDIRRRRSEVTDLRRWVFSAKSAAGAVDGEIEADAPDFVGLAYESPNGEITSCLNSKLARARVRLAVPGRAPFEATSRLAALEIGTLDPGHGIPMLA